MSTRSQVGLYQVLCFGIEHCRTGCNAQRLHSGMDASIRLTTRRHLQTYWASEVLSDSTSHLTGNRHSAPAPGLAHSHTDRAIVLSKSIEVDASRNYMAGEPRAWLLIARAHRQTPRRRRGECE